MPFTILYFCVRRILIQVLKIYSAIKILYNKGQKKVLCPWQRAWLFLTLVPCLVCLFMLWHQVAFILLLNYSSQSSVISLFTNDPQTMTWVFCLNIFNLGFFSSKKRNWKTRLYSCQRDFPLQLRSRDNTLDRSVTWTPNYDIFAIIFGALKCKTDKLGFKR